MLILIRHGNTFGPGDKVVFVGARSDLPLVEKGRAQATALGRALVEAAMPVASIRCGPLRRTREAAEIIADLRGFPKADITIDERLREIDYGRWEGLSAEEIRARFGAAELENWEARGMRPHAAGWQPSESELARNAEAVLATPGYGQAVAAAHLVVSSNGILRYFGAALFDAPAHEFKMRTGHASLVPANRASANREHWNLAPEQVAARLGADFS